MDLDAMRAIAREAALVGGRVVAGSHPPRSAEAKGAPGDWVTVVDLESERAIAAFLAHASPDVPVTGEELGGAAPEGLRWVVDPLDGTTNYVHGFWAVGVSVALVQDSLPLAGAVHAPVLGDLWHAARGAGAAWERRPGEVVEATVSAREPAEAVVATGFPFRRKDRLPRYLTAQERALATFEDLRRPGAACLDLAWTACGIFDGFFELGLSAWDVAAGGLLVEEAGGVVTDWDGDADYLSGNILAGPAPVYEELRSMAAAAGGNPAD